MVSMVLSKGSFTAAFDIFHRDVNTWIRFAMQYGYHINLEAYSPDYAAYLQSFPLNDPRD